MNFTPKELIQYLNEATDGKRYRVDTFPKTFWPARPRKQTRLTRKMANLPDPSLEKSDLWWENPEDAENIVKDPTRNFDIHKIKDEIRDFPNSLEDPETMHNIERVMDLYHDPKTAEKLDITPQYFNNFFTQLGKEAVKKLKDSNLPEKIKDKYQNILKNIPMEQGDSLGLLYDNADKLTPEVQMLLAQKNHKQNDTLKYHSVYDKNIINRIHPEVRKHLIKNSELAHIKPLTNEGLTNEEWKSLLFDRNWSPSGLIRLLHKYKNIPPEFISEFYKDHQDHPNDETSNYLNYNIAEHPNTPQSLLHKLAGSEDYNVKSNVAKNPSTHSVTLEKLANDDDVYVLKSLTNNPKITQEFLHKLALKNNFELSSYIAEHPNVHPKTLQHIANSFYHNPSQGEFTSNILSAVMASPNVNQKTLHIISKHPDSDLRDLVATDKKTHPDTLNALSNDKNNNIKLSVAKNPSTALKTLEQMAKNKEPSIHKAIAENPNASSDLLDYLHQHSDDYPTHAAIAGNINTRPETLEKLADHPTDYTKFSVAGNPNTPIHVLKKLTDYHYNAVKNRARRNLEDRRVI